VVYIIRELAKMIIKLAGSRSRLIYSLLPQDDPIRRQPDISPGRKIFGWEPKVPLEHGLRKSIECFGEKLPATKTIGHAQTAGPLIGETIPNEAAQ